MTSDKAKMRTHARGDFLPSSASSHVVFRCSLFLVPSAFCLSAFLTACAAGPKPHQPAKPRAADIGPVTPGTAPIMTVPVSGLEVQWWVADNTDNAVGAALYELSDGPAPMPPEQARAWIDNGLRMARLPLKSLAAFQQRAPSVYTLERTWLGGATQWTPMFTGRRTESGAVSVDGSTTTLQPGVLRFIGRAWPAPSREGDVVRLELALQLQTRQRDEALAALKLKAAGPATPAEEGPIFSRMTLDTALTPGWVYVIAPERPGVEWEEKNPKRRADADGAAPQLGPQVLPPPTLGEAMMAIDPPRGADRPGTRPLKAVVVLVPR